MSYLIRQDNFGGLQVFESILNNLPPYFSRYSFPIEIFSVSEATAVEACHTTNRFRVKTNLKEYFFDIKSKTISQLKSSIVAAGLTVRTKNNTYDKLYCFTLVPGKKDKVYYENSVNRRICGAIAQALLDWYGDAQTAINALYMNDASNFWLDLWGTYFGLYRRNNETDVDYINRIRYEVLTIRVNEKSIERILSNIISYPCNVVDNPVSNYFSIYFSGAPNNVTFRNYLRDVVDPIVRRHKAAGCHPKYYIPALGFLDTNTIIWTNPTGDTPMTKVSASSFTLTGNYTQIYRKGVIVQLTVDGLQVRGIVSSNSVFAGGITTVVLTENVIKGTTITDCEYATGKLTNDILYFTAPAVELWTEISPSA